MLFYKEENRSPGKRFKSLLATAKLDEVQAGEQLTMRNTE